MRKWYSEWLTMDSEKRMYYNLLKNNLKLSTRNLFLVIVSIFLYFFSLFISSFFSSMKVSNLILLSAVLILSISLILLLISTYKEIMKFRKDQISLIEQIAIAMHIFLINSHVFLIVFWYISMVIPFATKMHA